MGACTQNVNICWKAVPGFAQLLQNISKLVAKGLIPSLARSPWFSVMCLLSFCEFDVMTKHEEAWGTHFSWISGHFMMLSTAQRKVKCFYYKFLLNFWPASPPSSLAGLWLYEHLFELIYQVLSEGLKLFSLAQTKSFEHWLSLDSVPLCTKQQMCLPVGLVVLEILYHRCHFSLTTQMNGWGVSLLHIGSKPSRGKAVSSANSTDCQ